MTVVDDYLNHYKDYKKDYENFCTIEACCVHMHKALKTNAFLCKTYLTTHSEVASILCSQFYLIKPRVVK